LVFNIRPITNKICCLKNPETPNTAAKIDFQHCMGFVKMNWRIPRATEDEKMASHFDEHRSRIDTSPAIPCVDANEWAFSVKEAGTATPPIVLASGNEDSVSQPEGVIRLGDDDGDVPTTSPLWSGTGVPSWLASLAIHLAVFVFFASRILPDVRNSRISTLIMRITNVSNEDLVTLPPAIETATAASTDSAATETISNLIQQVAMLESPLALEIHPRDDSTSSSPSSSAAASETQTPLASIPSIHALAPHARMEPSRAKPDSSWFGESELDDVVNRFIEYDLGKLRGVQGQRAVQEFNKLGSEAIPALVRGLNKAARYHASCPVGVLGGKLSEAVCQTSDPALIRFAIDHLGDGVTGDMPHARTVRAIRDRLAQLLTNYEEVIPPLLAAVDLPEDKQHVHRVRQFLSAEEFRLVWAIRDAELPGDRQAALVATRIRVPLIRDVPQLGYALAEVLADTSTEEGTRRMTHDMLREVAAGVDFGNTPDDAPAWKIYWRHRNLAYETSRIISEFEQAREADRLGFLRWMAVTKPTLNRRSRCRLGMAMLPDLDSSDSKRAQAAHECLVMLAGGKDLGESAANWETYWNDHQKTKLHTATATSRYRQGMALLERGKSDAAEEYFKDIMATFPNSDEAAAAKRQLNTMIKRRSTDGS
jgi:hypothetical protein